MEIRFDRDLKHNYMVLCGARTGEDYRLKMLKENAPKGLLKCSLRNINGAGYLYYEIDSRQPLRNRFADGSLRYPELSRLLHDILALEDTLEEYLLDMEQVMFSPDCVYCDMRSGGFYFVYCPFTDDGEDAAKAYTFSSFTEELLGFLDPDDAQAATLAYRLCELAGHEEIRVVDAVTAAEEEAGESGDAGTAREIDAGEQEHYRESRSAATDRTGSSDDLFRALPENGADRTGHAHTGPVGETDYAAVLAAMDAEEAGPGNGGGKKKGICLIMLILFLGTFIGNLIIRRFFVLNAKENLLSVAVAGVSLIMALIQLIRTVRAFVAKEDDDDGCHAGTGRKRRREEEGNETDWVQPVCVEAELIGTMEGSNIRTGKAHDRQREVRRESAVSEETTVLSEAEAAAFGASRLYGRNDGETVNIDLAKLPLTVGKLSGCADFVLQDASVSRMHVRFTGDGTGRATAMQDLNSTNGTWLNGRRLKPNESVSIRTGDEIGIGRLRFEFR